MAATRRSLALALVLGLALAAPRDALAQGTEDSPAKSFAEETDQPANPEPLLFRPEITLRAYAIYPKFRFRKGSEDGPGSSFRTQRIGLDNWAMGPGLSVGMWVEDTARVGVHFWGTSGGGAAIATKPMTIESSTIAVGDVIRTDYVMWYAAAEYLHRFELFDGVLRLEPGVRVEHLHFRGHVFATGRANLNAVWPSPRLEVGVRPLPWVELRAWTGGFTLDFPVGNTKVTQIYEVGAQAEVELIRGVHLQLGAFMLHVHLEEHVGDLREEVLHLRHRALFTALRCSF